MDDVDRKRFILGVDIGRAISMLGIEATFNTQTSKWVAKCPNAILGHEGEDRNPSWTIQDDIHSEAHGVHGCWSCGYAGHIIGLVQDVLDLNNWKEAMAWLQTHAMRGKAFAPLSIDVEVIEPTVNRELDIPLGVEPLRSAPHKFKAYWLMDRHFTMPLAEQWGVGYALSGECFNRIWLPIRDRNGRLGNWTARSIDGREPRYLRASSALEPDKGIIFGEMFWDALPNDVVAVSEGEFNCITLDSVFQVPVAGLGGGSKLTPIHAAKLSRFKRIIHFADGDHTGDSLTRQLRDLCKPMAILRFHEGQDPNSIHVSELIRYGRQVGLISKNEGEMAADSSSDSPSHPPLVY